MKQTNVENKNDKNMHGIGKGTELKEIVKHGLYLLFPIPPVDLIRMTAVKVSCSAKALIIFQSN